MDINMECLPDVWAPSATPIQAQELPNAKHPVKFPPSNAPHSTGMAETMVQPADACDELHSSSVQVSAAVRCHELEASSSRQDHGPVLGAFDCSDYADDFGSHDGAIIPEAGQIPDFSRRLSAPERPSLVWGSRLLHEDLRPVRVSSHPSRRSASTRAAKSESSSQNTPGSSKGRGKGEGKDKACGTSLWNLKAIIYWLGTLFALISGLFLGTTSIHNSNFDSRDASGYGSAGGGESSTTFVFDEPGNSQGCLPSTTDGDQFQPKLDLVEQRCPSSRGLMGRSGVQLPGRGSPRAGSVPDADRQRSLSPGLHGSADDPLTYEDRGFALMKPGRQKRLLGSIRALRQIWMVEHSVYNNIVHSNRKLRRHKVDLVEIYGGHANVTARALECGLRVLQPIDRIHGVHLQTRADHRWLREKLREWSPFLTLIEPECRLWSPLAELLLETGRTCCSPSRCPTDC